MYRSFAGGLLLAAVVLVTAPAMALAAAPAPSASPTARQTGTLQVPLVGSNGTNAIATITRFDVVGGALTAVGTVTGQVTTLVGGVPVTTSVVNAPFTAPVASATGTCDILTLDIGAIHLDLLGLVVDLSPIHLSITAQSGSGNLLGNLLCAVAHLLDQSNAAVLQGIANLLNRILALR
ncbi:MAG TPA: hypothetical protein VGQ86_11755 [Candidatus Limnocylindria bacterium]|nr:hypothetical protein [Candidatus Limnocylindria bacterium]